MAAAGCPPTHPEHSPLAVPHVFDHFLIKSPCFQLSGHSQASYELATKEETVHNRNGEEDMKSKDYGLNFRARLNFMSFFLTRLSIELNFLDLHGCFFSVFF